MGDEHIGEDVDRASGSVNEEGFTYRSAGITGIMIACLYSHTFRLCCGGAPHGHRKGSLEFFKGSVQGILSDKEKMLRKRHSHPAICKYSLQCSKLTRTEQEGGIS